MYCTQKEKKSNNNKSQIDLFKKFNKKTNTNKK